MPVRRKVSKREPDVISARGSSLQEPEFDALSLAANSIYRMQIRYISRLVAFRSQTDLDIEQIANDVTYEFVCCYLGRECLGEMRTTPLLKKMARSRVANAIRDSQRKRRHPEKIGGNPIRFFSLDTERFVEDLNSQFQPIEFEEVLLKLEYILDDPVLISVYKLMVEGFLTCEIADKLSWEKHTVNRLVAQIRQELLPWCIANLQFCNGQINKSAILSGGSASRIRDVNSGLLDQSQIVPPLLERYLAGHGR